MQHPPKILIYSVAAGLTVGAYETYSDNPEIPHRHDQFVMMTTATSAGFDLEVQDTVGGEVIRYTLDWGVEIDGLF